MKKQTMIKKKKKKMGGDIYMKVFGQQTMEDILPGQTVLHLTGGNAILVPENNKYPFLFNMFFLLKIRHNKVIIIMPHWG